MMYSTKGLRLAVSILVLFPVFLGGSAKRMDQRGSARFAKSQGSEKEKAVLDSTVGAEQIYNEHNTTEGSTNLEPNPVLQGARGSSKPEPPIQVCCCKTGPCRTDTKDHSRPWPYGAEKEHHRGVEQWAVQHASENLCCKVISASFGTCLMSGYSTAKLGYDMSVCQVPKTVPLGWWIVLWKPGSGALSFKQPVRMAGKVALTPTPESAMMTCKWRFQLFGGYDCEPGDGTSIDGAGTEGAVLMHFNPISMLYWNPTTGYYHDPTDVTTMSYPTSIPLLAGQEPLSNTGFPGPARFPWLGAGRREADDNDLKPVHPPALKPRSQGMSGCIKVTCGACSIPDLRCKLHANDGVLSLKSIENGGFSDDYKRILSGTCEAFALAVGLMEHKGKLSKEPASDWFTRSPTQCVATEAVVMPDESQCNQATDCLQITLD